MWSALSPCKENLDVKPLKNLYVRALRTPIDLTCPDKPQHEHSLCAWNKSPISAQTWEPRPCLSSAVSVSEFSPVSGPASWMDSGTTAKPHLQSCLQSGFLLLLGWAPWMDPGPGLLLAMSGAVYQPCHQHPALPAAFELCVTAPGTVRDSCTRVTCGSYPGIGQPCSCFSWQGVSDMYMRQRQCLPLAFSQPPPEEAQRSL